MVPHSPAALDRSMLSVVVPVYNEEETLPELRSRLMSVLEEIEFDDFEIVMVSDGSTDGTDAVIHEMVAADPRIVGIFLTRNFGHQAAVDAGLHAARGSVVAVMDGDLQDPPEVIPELINALDRGADVAYGIRRNRKEGPVKRAAYWSFYRGLKLISSTDLALDAGDFCCMTRRVVDAMNRLPESRRFLRGLRSWVGYKQVGVEYNRDRRYAGKPKYDLVRLFGLAYDGVFSFSSTPIKFMQVIGFATAFLAGLIGLIYLILAFFVETPRGFPTVIVSIWFLGGLQLLAFGILGEYVHRTFDQTRRRPEALIREVLRQKEGEEGRRPDEADA
ncbi:MAG: glycosyltransferase family 2 protein, partial [Rhodothermales bacterium]|nr:glycosyltransferase family 2 protein [Rhodothermales bacterium]